MGEPGKEHEVSRHQRHTWSYVGGEGLWLVEVRWVGMGWGWWLFGNYKGGGGGGVGGGRVAPCGVVRRAHPRRTSHLLGREGEGCRGRGWGGWGPCGRLGAVEGDAAGGGGWSVVVWVSVVVEGGAVTQGWPGYDVGAVVRARTRVLTEVELECLNLHRIQGVKRQGGKQERNIQEKNNKEGVTVGVQEGGWNVQRVEG